MNATEEMVEDQFKNLISQFEEIHDQVHKLYPRNNPMTESDKELRNRLLVIDLTMHLAQEVVGDSSVDEQQVTERTANLLHALRLIAPEGRFEHATRTLLDQAGSAREIAECTERIT